jgi:uncharacterized protein YegL
MTEQEPYPSFLPPADAQIFAENPTDRVSCLLLLDTSASMRGAPIEELNRGLASFCEDLAADSKARMGVDVAIITFGPVRVVQDFSTAGDFTPPTLTAEGDTPMGAAIEKALALTKARKESYRANGIHYYRPWIFMITDGAPTDAWEPAALKLTQAEGGKSVLFYAVGVEGANLGILKKLSVREPLTLQGLNFRSLFQWLSGSMKRVSQSRIGEAVTLDNPTGPEGWATTA